MLDPCCDFERWPSPWPWPLISNIKFWNSHIPGMGGPIDMEQKGYELIGGFNLPCDLELSLWPWIFKVKIWKCCITRMVGPIDMEPKECELKGCKTHIVTLNCDLTHDLDLGFSRPIFKIAVSQEQDGWSTRINTEQKGYESIGCYPTMWPWVMVLILDFKGHILKMLYHRNKRVDWHGTKRMWATKMLDTSLDFKPSKSFKVKFLIAIF